MISHTGESPAIVLYATMEPLMAYGTIIGLRLFTNNLFMIAKCVYATPDPFQPDHQYLRVHYIGPLCLISHVPSLQPTSFFQTFAKFLSVLFPVTPSPTAVSPAQTLSCMS